MRLAVVAIACAAVLLAGCGGDGPAQTVAQSTSPAAATTAETSSDTPTPAVSETPAETVASWWAGVQPTFALIQTDAAGVGDPNGYTALAACSTLKTHVTALQALPVSPDAQVAADLDAMGSEYAAAAASCLYVPNDPTFPSLLANAGTHAAAVQARVGQLS